MEHLTDHERIGPILASHERRCTLCAAEHEEHAELARTRKTRELGMHINAPSEARKRMEATHDEAIARHEGQARMHRRRAEHAAAGYLLHGPDEGRDSEYMRANQELIGMARRTGRLRQTDESIA
jgi:hypothetical protein